MLENHQLTPQVDGNATSQRTIWPSPTHAESVVNENAITTDPINPSYTFRVNRDIETKEITGVVASSPDRHFQQALTRSDDIATTVYHRSTTRHDDGTQETTWKRFFVHDFTLTTDKRLRVTLIHHPDYTSYPALTKAQNIKTDVNYISTTVPAARLCENLIGSKTSPDAQTTWTTTASKWRPDGSAVSTFTSRYLPPDSPYVPIDSCSDLEFRRIKGDGAHKKVDGFLNGETTPAVEHNLGGTKGKWKAAFGAFYTPSSSNEELLIAVLTIENHQNREYYEKHNEALITRIACHPMRPKNTSTWMIARTRD